MPLLNPCTCSSVSCTIKLIFARPSIGAQAHVQGRTHTTRCVQGETCKDRLKNDVVAAKQMGGAGLAAPKKE